MLDKFDNVKYLPILYSIDVDAKIIPFLNKNLKYKLLSFGSQIDISNPNLDIACKFNHYGTPKIRLSSGIWAEFAIIKNQYDKIITIYDNLNRLDEITMLKKFPYEFKTFYFIGIN